MGGTCLYVLDIALEVSKEEGFGDGVIKARMAHWTAATTTTSSGGKVGSFDGEEMAMNLQCKII